MNHLDHYDKVEKEDNRIIGKTYLIIKKYFYYRNETTMFFARLLRKQFNVGIAFNHSFVHHHYYDQSMYICKNGTLDYDYVVPFTTSYVPPCDHIHLYSTEFYKKKPIAACLKKEIHVRSFLQIKSVFEEKTGLPEDIISTWIEHYI